MKHTCHVPGCDKSVPPSKLMCWDHWKKVPKTIKQAVLDTYRPGQERDKNPSDAWILAARAAIKSVYEPATETIILFTAPAPAEAEKDETR